MSEQLRPNNLLEATNMVRDFPLNAQAVKVWADAVIGPVEKYQTTTTSYIEQSTTHEVAQKIIETAIFLAHELKNPEIWGSLVHSDHRKIQHAIYSFYKYGQTIRHQEITTREYFDLHDLPVDEEPSLEFLLGEKKERFIQHSSKKPKFRSRYFRFLFEQYLSSLQESEFSRFFEKLESFSINAFDMEQVFRQIYDVGVESTLQHFSFLNLPELRAQIDYSDPVKQSETEIEVVRQVQRAIAKNLGYKEGAFKLYYSIDEQFRNCLSGTALVSHALTTVGIQNFFVGISGKDGEKGHAAVIMVTKDTRVFFVETTAEEGDETSIQELKEFSQRAEIQELISKNVSFLSFSKEEAKEVGFNLDTDETAVEFAVPEDGILASIITSLVITLFDAREYKQAEKLLQVGCEIYPQSISLASARAKISLFMKLLV